MMSLWSTVLSIVVVVVVVVEFWLVWTYFLEPWLDRNGHPTVSKVVWFGIHSFVHLVLWTILSDWVPSLRVTQFMKSLELKFQSSF